MSVGYKIPLILFYYCQVFPLWLLIFTLYLGAPILGTYMSTGVLVSSILIPSSFFMDFFVLKSILSDMNIVTPAFVSFHFYEIPFSISFLGDRNP